MKINDSNANNVGSTRYESTRGPDGVRSGNRGTGGVSSSSSDGDDVQLSGLTGLLKSASSGSAERAQKTRKLAQQVQAGTYQVDAQALSRRLVDEMLGRGV
ncbi:MAG: flagellar biosynthesis anti-sigma factor FlgM [Acidobacteria bacterium]|nr:flagellar biosynthesis anti-sigma factor FlgM [Acidobacteriota bacterium]